MLKLVMMPPQDELTRQWARRLEHTLPHYQVAVPQTDEEAHRELADADAAYDWVPPEVLPTVQKLRWLQNPQAGAAAGWERCMGWRHAHALETSYTPNRFDHHG